MNADKSQLRESVLRLKSDFENLAEAIRSNLEMVLRQLEHFERDASEKLAWIADALGRASGPGDEGDSVSEK